MTRFGPASRRIMLLVGPVIGSANALAGALVTLFLIWVLPTRAEQFDLGRAVLVNVAVFVVFMGIAYVAMPTVQARVFGPIAAWLEPGRDPTPDEALATLRHPLRQTMLHTAIWLAALPVFVPLNLTFSARLGGDVLAGIVLAALSTWALSYLLIERIERPLTVRALAVVRTPYRGPGVTRRILIAWALGSGVPLVGIALYALDRRPGDPPLSSAPLLFLVAIGLVTGALVIHLAVSAVAEPLRAVTQAMAEVEQGRLDLSVTIFDASEVGRLQSGFNAMVAGLRERRELREIFGRQVGDDVARHVLERGPSLGGETVTAAVLFVDVVGSTALAHDRSAAQVVQALNHFFGIVVDVVAECGGIVNKFEGDAALCVFGAPVRRADAAACALVAARRLHERLRAEQALDAGIGVSCGQVVAGNIGAAERFEYTVIGDPVNEAARLTDLAKSEPGRVLAAASVVEAAGEPEASRWAEDGAATLRGRPAPTRLVRPR